MTNSALTVQAFAPASTVRNWAIENGLPAGGQRGLIPASTIKAYNASNGLKFKYRAHKPVKVVTTKDARGRTVQRKVNVAQARALLNQNGHTTGTRGRLSPSQLQLALTLA